MVYPFPQTSRDIASLAIWSSHKVAASFSSQTCSSGACIGGSDDRRNLECRQWRMSAHGTSRTSRDVRLESAKRAKADIDQDAVADVHIQNDESGTVKTCYRSRLVLRQLLMHLNTLSLDGETESESHSVGVFTASFPGGMRQAALELVQLADGRHLRSH